MRGPCLGSPQPIGAFARPEGRSRGCFCPLEGVEPSRQLSPLFHKRCSRSHRARRFAARASPARPNRANAPSGKVLSQSSQVPSASAPAQRRIPQCVARPANVAAVFRRLIVPGEISNFAGPFLWRAIVAACPRNWKRCTQNFPFGWRATSYRGLCARVARQWPAFRALPLRRCDACTGAASPGRELGTGRSLSERSVVVRSSCGSCANDCGVCSYPMEISPPRAYRIVLTDAGHICQTFCLVATWLGLAPFCTMALADSRIEAALRIDGVGESVLYAAGVGTPPRNSKWAPGPARVPLGIRRPNPAFAEL